MEKFWVKTGTRLHLGQIDLNGSLGRLYGGMGLAIDSPQLELVAEKSADLRVAGSDYKPQRVENIANQYLKFYNLPGVKIELLKSLPEHCGLGSGTQLSLALGLAITRVYGLEPSLTELASITDREGSRSGIGVAAFEQGGFLVDGGRPISKEKGQEESRIVPPLLARIPFPKEWAVIVALPHKKEKMCGAEEKKAFQALPPMDEYVSGSIGRLLLMKVLPGLIEKDLKNFGHAVTEIQNHLGNYFEPVQGGQFATALGYDLAKYWLAQGVVGVGQSSWGPTVYGFIIQEDQAAIEQKTKDFLGEDGHVWITKGSNHGAKWGWEYTNKYAEGAK